MIKNKCRFNRVVCKRRKVLKCYKKLNAKSCFRPLCCKLFFRGNKLVAKRCRNVGKMKCPVRIFHNCNKKRTQFGCQITHCCDTYKSRGKTIKKKM